MPTWAWLTVLTAVLVASAAGVYVGRATLGLPGPSPTVPAIASPTETPSPSPDMATVYVVARDRPPLAVSTEVPRLADTVVGRVFARMDALERLAPPEGYLNPLAQSSARLVRVTNDEPNVISFWFEVPDGDWGISAEDAPLFLEQLVWTATEEPGIELIRFLQNDGFETASIDGVIANYEMRREDFR